MFFFRSSFLTFAQIWECWKINYLYIKFCISWRVEFTKTLIFLRMFTAHTHTHTHPQTPHTHTPHRMFTLSPEYCSWLLIVYYLKYLYFSTLTGGFDNMEASIAKYIPRYMQGNNQSLHGKVCWDDQFWQISNSLNCHFF